VVRDEPSCNATQKRIVKQEKSKSKADKFLTFWSNDSPFFDEGFTFATFWWCRFGILLFFIVGALFFLKPPDPDLLRLP
jgi:hypothetical protein